MRRITAQDDVAVLGTGTMGEGIAEVLASAGHRVRLYDVAPDAAAGAVTRIGRRLARLVAQGHLEPDVAAAVQGRLQVVDTLDALAGCGLVVEAVREDLATKRDLLRAVERVVAEGVGHEVLLATNTSALSVTAIGQGLQQPGTLVGLHFFNPAPRMSLVEVVRGDASDPKAVEAAVEAVRDWGKTPVVCSSTPGFVVNRIARPFYGEAHRLVERRVADPATIDAVLRETGGFPMGPFQLGDLVGHDVGLAVSKAIWEQTFHDPRYAPTTWHQRLVDAGRFGRKTGRGVYAYSPDGQALDAAPQTAPPREAPASIEVLEYDFGVMGPFLDRIAEGGVDVQRVALSDEEVMEQLPGVRLPGDGLLRVTDGSTPRGRGRSRLPVAWCCWTGRTIPPRAPAWCCPRRGTSPPRRSTPRSGCARRPARRSA